MSWESVAKSAIHAQDEWRKAYSAMKSEHEKAEVSWKSVAKQAITTQDEWRKAYSTIKAVRYEENRDWELIVKRAISAQDEWRKECATLKTARLNMEEPKLPTTVVREAVQFIRAKTVPTNEKACQTEEAQAITEVRLKEKDDHIDELRADAAERIREKEKAIHDLRTNAAEEMNENDKIIYGLQEDAAEWVEEKAVVVDELQAKEAECKEKDEVVGELRTNAAERETTHNATIRLFEKKIRQMYREAQSHQTLIADMRNEILRRDKVLERLWRENMQSQDSE